MGEDTHGFTPWGQHRIVGRAQLVHVGGMDHLRLTSHTHHDCCRGVFGRLRILQAFRTPVSRPGMTARIRIGRFALHLFANCCLVMAASGVGHALARPARDESTEAQRAVESLIHGQADPTVIPSNFDAILGYRPDRQSRTLARPDGQCSAPFGIGPDSFEPACRTHDFGYDLLRYAEQTDGRLAAWARLRLDLRLYRDLRQTCDTSRCHATAVLYLVSLTGNSARQGFTAPMTEPVSPWAAVGCLVILVSAWTACRRRDALSRTVPVTRGARRLGNRPAPTWPFIVRHRIGLAAPLERALRASATAVASERSIRSVVIIRHTAGSPRRRSRRSSAANRAAPSSLRATTIA